MSDPELEQLVRQALESELADEPAAPSPRCAECLSMGRLDVLARTQLTPTHAERRHLAACGLCRRRYAALADATESRTDGRGQRLVLAVGALGLLGAAASIALLIASHAAVGPQAVPVAPVARPEAPLVRTEPPLAAQPILTLLPVSYNVHSAAPAIRPDESFAAKCDDGCVVLAVFRGCSEACVCGDWQVHRWDEQGRTLAELDPDEAVEIALDVTGNPAIGQLLVLASPCPGVGGSPPTGDIRALLECLNSVQSQECRDDGLAAYASAVRSCLPTAVTLVEQTFYGTPGEASGHP